MESPFDVLRLDPDADEQAIDRAYRQRVKETHPDHGGSAEEFQLVSAAYEELTEGTVNEEAGESGVHRQAATEVEYLNYEALDDHEWTLDDEDLFEKAAQADLDSSDYGRIQVRPDEYLLEGAERCGQVWPFACRGGACANCAIALTDGELGQPVDHILPPEMIDQGIRLSCMGAPVTDELQVVYNIKHLPDLDDLRLPPHPFTRSHPTESASDD